MEHLPLLHNATLTQHDEVPYVAFDHGYNGSLFSYLKRTNRPEMREGSKASLRFQPTAEYQYENSYKLAPLYQTWLSFGFLDVILGPTFRHQDFVAMASDSRAVSGNQDNVKLPDIPSVAQVLHVRSLVLDLTATGTWPLRPFKLSRSINEKLRPDEPCKVICTTLLPGLLDEWIAKIKNNPDVSDVLFKARASIGMVY